MVRHRVIFELKPNNQAEDFVGQLDRLLDEWKELTEAEKVAIISSDWSRLESLQEKKTQRQRAIQDAENALTSASRLTPDELVRVRRRLQTRTGELLRLEEENRGLLAREMASTSGRLKISERAIRSLRNVQNAYGARSRSFWHAYS